jgi:hypothetical protein
MPLPKEQDNAHAPEREEGKFEVVYWGCWRATFSTYSEAKAFYDEQDEAAVLWDITEGAVWRHAKDIE